MNLESGPRVAVAFSGGVDSAMAAILLKRRGFDVLALTMLLPSRRANGRTSCEQPRALAAGIGLEHEILDLERDFERIVIGPFADAYMDGLTPNPCVACNRELKFGILLNEARKRGCEYLATGHYARLSGGDGTAFKVLRARDRGKDQSYALWTLDQAILRHVMLPLGELTKNEVGSMFREAGLKAEVHPESQDICFMSGESYSSFLEERAGKAFRPGPIVDMEGSVLGEHRGLPFYTVGQRRGLGLGGNKALYVIEIRPGDNTIVVGEKEHRTSSCFHACKINFISGEPPKETVLCDVSTRYRGAALPAELRVSEGGRALVRYFEPGPPAAPGQSAVFYRGEEVLGGGVISRPDNRGS